MIMDVAYMFEEFYETLSGIGQLAILCVIILSIAAVLIVGVTIFAMIVGTAIRRHNSNNKRLD